MTTVPGVFAAGETVTGMHGADRLGGNMLSACLVFGIRAADSAIKWAKQHPAFSDLDQICEEKTDIIIALRSSSGKTSPKTLIVALRDSAWNHGLTIRSEESLTRLLADIGRLQDAYAHEMYVKDPSDLVAALELRNLLWRERRAGEGIIGKIIPRTPLTVRHGPSY